MWFLLFSGVGFFCLAVFFASAVTFHKLLFHSNKEIPNGCIHIFQYEICTAESLGFYLNLFLCFIFVIKTKGFVFCMQSFTEGVKNTGFTR